MDKWTRRKGRELPLIPRPGDVYLVWAEDTFRFKIGWTQNGAERRLLELSTSSPFPLRLIAHRPGTMRTERMLHSSLKRLRRHGEWFELPESVVWQLLKWFGVPNAEQAERRAIMELSGVQPAT